MICRIIALLMLAGCACAAQRDYIGAQYVGATYLADPLGEAAGPDSDPLIRFDAFDCTTFVETVLAGGDVDRLTQIRYRNGEIGFLTRNHFIETDWLKNNAARFENVSANYGPTRVRRVDVDKSGWLRRVHGIDAVFPVVSASVEYIPYSHAADIRPAAPMIVLFIAGNSGKSATIGTDIAVVHMGFLLPDGTLRHASSAAGRVVDVNFAEYVHARMQNKNNLGITLVEIK